MTKINLLDEHRKSWLKYLTKRKTFRGKVERFGHKHKQGNKIKRGATIVLVDVHLKNSPLKIDHAWLDYTVEIAKFGEEVIPGSLIEFSAIVSTYKKGGKNIYGKGQGTYDDLELTDVTNVKVISHPRLKKDAIINDKLISYAIGTRTNVKHGLFIGNDPYGKLGHIYVGQTFANRLSRLLSYKYRKDN